MAPIYPRQNHSLVPAPPRPPKGPSTPPVEVTTSIDPKVFGELFAGTVGIFIIAVIVWKTGKFIRSFSRHRILKKDNAATARYARTWYGWIPMETHQRNKAIFRGIFTRLRKWTAWKSTRTDYRWVWWDPEQEEMKARQRDQRPLRWLPECVKSYDITPPDAIWNPRPLAKCHGALLDGSGSEQPPSLKSSQRSCEAILNPLSPRCSNQHSRNCERTSSTSLETCKPNTPLLNVKASDDQSEDVQWSDARMTKIPSTISLENQAWPRMNTLRSPAEERSWPLSNFDGSHSPKLRGSLQIPKPVYFPITQESAGSSAHLGLRNYNGRRAPSKRYRVWSAQMQVNRQKLALTNLRDSSGPPGTPSTAILGSHLSDSSAAGSLLVRQTTGPRGPGIPFEWRSLEFDQDSTASQVDAYSKWRGAKYRTAPIRYHPGSQRGQIQSHAWQSLRNTKAPWARGTVHIAHPPQGKAVTGHRTVEYSTIQNPVSRANPLDELLDWEVRLVDHLDRKLIWMFNETTPGQKPYHFARLANHWLNRETWLVLDPVSRVSIDKRRERGDPRFNVPYPERDLSPRAKYPVPIRRRAHTPRIDSWRVAMNRQRRVSGVRDVIRTVTLYEDSVEEPPDGKIDTACWILPKPPQGFEMSTKQKNAWYEGGYGWQEKLEDWQQVRRGYRLHQALHEGRVNRNRVKELAKNVNRCCRTVSAKLIPSPTNQTAQPSLPAC